ncbi:hypothetical protein G4B11_003629 [Aspergillus flavus]|nr:hypothetical protein G4B11_003629 [Aspergillus flavus]
MAKNMNRVLKADPEKAYVLLEPGVSYFDLHEYLVKHNLRWSTHPHWDGFFAKPKSGQEQAAPRAGTKRELAFIGFSQSISQSQYTNSNKPLTDLELGEISENLNVGRWNLYGAIPGSPGGTSILLSDRQSNDRDAKAHMFVVGAREMHHIVCILFDRKDPDSRNRAYKLIQVLIAEAADWAGFNENAQMKLNEKVKNTHDPKGTLCPGKNGIWPANYRKED